MKKHPQTLAKGTKVEYHGFSKNIPVGSVGTVICHRRSWKNSNTRVEWENKNITVTYVHADYLITK